MTKKSVSNFRTFLMLMNNQGGFLRMFSNRYPLMAPDDDGKGGGGAKTAEEQLKEAQAQIEELKKQVSGNKNKDEEERKRKEEEDNDLRKKVAKEKEEEEKKKKDTKSVEDVLKYNLTVNTYVKENKDVLPEEFEKILQMAEKETYDTAAEKANAIKASFIQAFFSVQANIDLLTSSQKSQIEDYLKLTKKGREDGANQIYQNLFEPTIEMVKKLKKAEELNRARTGLHPGSKAGDEYRDRLIEMGKKRFKVKGQ